MLRSDYTRLAPVALPYAGRQMYMHTFDLADPQMPEGYEDYLEPVTRLCAAADAVEGVAYMTVDEKIVRARMSQRRPGPHVDGCFVPANMTWEHPGPGWTHPRPGPASMCNNIAAANVQRMSVIVAASVAGCRAWRGTFEAVPNEVGDLSHIADRLPPGEVLQPNMGYLLSPDCVHESMIFDCPTRRTFLRIALPLEYNA